MNSAFYRLSRMTPRSGLDFCDLVALGRLDPYGQHQLVWKFFDLPREPTPRQVPFLFRAEVRDGLPLLYVLSRAEPRDISGKWRIESKDYHPALTLGDRLAFKLRANPTVARPGDVVLDRDGTQKLRTSGLKTGQPKHRSKRHDVVMDAKQRMDWQALPPEERPSLAYLAYEAGAGWLREREGRLGCQFNPARLRVDGYRTYRMNRKRGISLSTVDFEGELQVTDLERFTPVLFSGIGPAKAFGCGLILVRRITEK